MTRVAVIGAGYIGRHHARIYREMSRVELVAVADVNRAALDEVAALYSVRGYTDYEDMLEREKPDAVTVAVPTKLHKAVSETALSAGCHVLVEKPIAGTMDEAVALAAAGQKARRVLMVGHVERYNPAIIELRRRLKTGEAGRVFQVHARRLGPFPARVRDVGVIIDSATHDLDIMRFLIAAEATRVYAETKREVHSSSEDLLIGMLRFADDTVGLLEINWLTPTKIRELVVTGERGMFQANYLTQDLYFYENAEIRGSGWSTFDVLRGVSEGPMVRFALDRQEPLRAEQEAFVDAVEGHGANIVTAEDGVAALKLALDILQSSERHQPLQLEAPWTSTASV